MLRTTAARASGIAVACAVFTIAVPAAATTAKPASGVVSLRGTVSAARKPLASARVTLFGSSAQGATELGHATTDASGRFTISYEPGSATALYLDATPAGSSRLRLRAVAGVASGGEVQPTIVSTVSVDELTTVAAAYALAQFSGPDGIAGPSPGLENAAATAFNLAGSGDGKAGSVVTNADNGSKNDTLATLDTLANLVSLCAPGASRGCGAMLRLATPPGGTVPADTAQAVVDLARNPTLAPAALYALSRKATVYQPALGAPPAAWILVLLYTDKNLYASGRVAIDAKGNVWSSTNWLPGTQNPSTSISVLDPVGRPTLGSPIQGGGMQGGAWGAAITPQGTVWMGSFGGNSVVKYSPTGTILSPGDGYTAGTLDHPQGIAVDQKGNIWIANNFGPESAPGQGNVVVYPGGDPSKAIVITGGGLNHPFAVQIDGYGRAWVTNAGLGGARLVGTRLAPLVGKFGGSVTVIGTDFKPTSFSPIESSSFKWPLGLSIDSQNNAWITNYFSNAVTEIAPDGSVANVYKLPRGTIPWSEAVDGSDRVWVAGFVRPVVWLLCGANTSGCPPGSTTGTLLSPRLGFRSKAFQHFTSIQFDQSGNVWLSNNWSHLAPPVGGNGIAEMIGAATPVCAPLTPLPVTPSSSGTPCPEQIAAALPASLEGGSGGDLPTWAWIAIGAGIAVLLAVAALVLRRRRPPAEG
jgi:streptogramin lyase